MKQSFSLIAILCTLCLSSCLSKTPASLWFYTHTSGTVAKEDSLLTPASFLNLKRDGTYTSDFGSFEYGHWTKQDDELLLTNEANKTTRQHINALDVNELQLLTNKKIVANFEAQPDRFSKKEDDPFSVENNRWRIKATHKESEEEIRNRLINHCRFWVAYFNWANENQLQTVDVRSTPTLIKIYGNGFGLKPFLELPITWRTYFYDNEDCRIANNLMYEVFQYNEISWAHTDNKYKFFISAFQQLMHSLQKQ